MYNVTPLESIDPSELLNNEAYRWLHNAILRNFTDLAYTYYFDKNNHELFTLFILTVYVLKGEEGSNKVEIQGLNDEQKSVILSRINRIDNEDSDIIEIPRLFEGEWNTLLEAVILKNDDSKDSNTLKKNLEYIHQEQFQLESILMAFLNGILKPGVDIVLDTVGLRSKLNNADLVITGEGCLDYQTIYNKAPIGVARMAKEMNIPTIAVCGMLGNDFSTVHNHGIEAACSITNGPLSLEQSSAMSYELAADAVEQNIRLILLGARIGETRSLTRDD